MIYRTGLRYAVSASSPQESRKNTTQNAFGGAALACIALACGWTLVSKAIGPGLDPVMASANVGSALSSQQPSFAERFEPVASGTSVVAKTKRAYVALFDPTWSLHAAPESFSSDSQPGMHCFRIAGSLSACQTLSRIAAMRYSPDISMEERSFFGRKILGVARRRFAIY